MQRQQGLCQRARRPQVRSCGVPQGALSLFCDVPPKVCIPVCRNYPDSPSTAPDNPRTQEILNRRRARAVSTTSSAHRIGARRGPKMKHFCVHIPTRHPRQAQWPGPAPHRQCTTSIRFADSRPNPFPGPRKDFPGRGRTKQAVRFGRNHPTIRPSQSHPSGRRHRSISSFLTYRTDMSRNAGAGSIPPLDMTTSIAVFRAPT